MKHSNIFYSFVACAAMLSAASCTDEPIITYGEMETGGPVEKVTLKASLPTEETDCFKTGWQSGDVLGIFGPSSLKAPRDFRIKAGESSAEASFEGNLPVSGEEESNELYAVYPYDWYAGSTSGADSYTISIPEKQTPELAVPEYMSGMVTDRNAVIELQPLTSVLEVSVGKIPEDETLTGMTLKTSDGSPLFAVSANVDLTSADQTILIADRAASVSSGIVSGDKVVFTLLPQEISGDGDVEIRSVITTTKSVYDQRFNDFSVKLEKGKKTAVGTDLLDRYGEGGFVFAENETARPGEGEWADYDVLPVRGEILNADGTPYSFLPNAALSAEANPVLRIWFVSRQNTTVGKWLALKSFEGGYGFDPVAVKKDFTGASVISGVKTDMEWDANKHYFFNAEDAEKYKISYADFQVDKKTKFVRLFKEEFTIECTVGGEGVSGHESDRLPYDDLTVPVTVHAVPSYIEITAEEEARIKEYLEDKNYNFVPMRGEYVTSKTVFTPYVFTPNVSVTGIAFRMLVAVRRDFVVPENGDKYMTTNTKTTPPTWLLGGNITELEEKFGTGTRIGIGTNGAAKSFASDMAGYVFESDELNEKYLLSCSVYDVNTPGDKNTAPEGYVFKSAGKENINIYFTKHKNNTDTSAPENLECPVCITVEARAE